MKRLLKELVNTFKQSDETYRWRATSFDVWWHGPTILLAMLLVGYWVINKSNFFKQGCPPVYYEKSVMPLLIKAKVIDIKGNIHERHNWLTWVLFNSNDTFNLTASRGWGDLENTIAINDSILKMPGKLDIVLVKVSGKRMLYKYICPE